MPLMAAVGAYIAQAVVTRRGYRPVAAAGLILMGAGCLMLAQVTVAGDYASDLLPALVIFGLGLGGGTVAAYAASLAGVVEREQGLASGVNSASFQIGGALGIAVVTTVMVSSSVGPTPPEAMTAGFRAGFGATVVFGIIGLFFALVLLGRSGRRQVPSVAQVSPAAQKLDA